MAWNWAASQPKTEEKKAAAPSKGRQTSYVAAIVRSAKKWGVDPKVALRVAREEGGVNQYIRAKGRNKTGKLEPAWGPFQLLVGGGDTGYVEGMGNQMIRERGLDPRDPANAEAGIDFAMEQASKHGWGQWYGAEKVGIVGKMGIGGRPSVGRAHASNGEIPSGPDTSGEAMDFNLLPVDDAELAQIDFGADEMPTEDPIEEEEKTLASVLGLKDVEWGNLFGEQDSTAINEQAQARKDDILALIMNGVEAQTSGSFLPGLPGPPGVSFDT